MDGREGCTHGAAIRGSLPHGIPTLAAVVVFDRATTPHNVRRPFGKESDSSATGIMYDLPDLLAHAEDTA